MTLNALLATILTTQVYTAPAVPTPQPLPYEQSTYHQPALQQTYELSRVLPLGRARKRS